MLLDCPPFKRRAVPAITFLVEDLLHRISALFFQQLFVGALNFSENCLLLLTFFRHSGNALTTSSCSWNVSISKEHLQSKYRMANKKLSRLKHTITNIKKKSYNHFKFRRVLFVILSTFHFLAQDCRLHSCLGVIHVKRTNLFC